MVSLSGMAALSSLVWVELKRSAPEHNLGQLRGILGPNVRLCAVVKANAYGHGVGQMIGLLRSADWLGVNSLEEALEIREHRDDRPVLILGHVETGRLQPAVAAGFRLTVYNPETLEVLRRVSTPNGPARIHIKIETGTGRQGVLPEEFPAFLDAVLESPAMVLEGISTHFAGVEDTLNRDYTQKQIGEFQSVLGHIKRRRIDIPLIHTAATAAMILFPQTHYDLVRSGIGIYGLWPSRGTHLSAALGKRGIGDLVPVLSWKTRLVQIKTLPEGSCVSYGCTYKTTRTTRIGVLPVGYADGYDRSLGNTAYVLIRGRRAPVLGRVCMNMIMVDLTDIPDVALEDEAVLLGASGAETLSAETMAAWAGTINYEIVTRISPLLERRIVEG